MNDLAASESSNVAPHPLGMTSEHEAPIDSHEHIGSPPRDLHAPSFEVEKAISPPPDPDPRDLREIISDATPPADFPRSWPHSDAGLWASLSPEVRARISQRESDRDAATQRAFNEANEHRQRAAQEYAREYAQHHGRALEALQVASSVLNVEGMEQWADITSPEA